MDLYCKPLYICKLTQLSIYHTHRKSLYFFDYLYMTACISVLILQFNDRTRTPPGFRLLNMSRVVNYLQLCSLKSNTTASERDHKSGALCFFFFFSKRRD